MEAFEHVVKVHLEVQGYVVTTNVKFPVRRKTLKAAREEHQTHGYEVDIVAAKGNELILGSVKSYLDSKGVNRQCFEGIADSHRKNDFGGYKIFNDEELRQKILEKAGERCGYAPGQIRVVLYVGKFKRGDEEIVRQHLGGIEAGAGPIQVVNLEEIVRGLIEASESTTYVNDPVVMTIKALQKAGYLREPARRESTEAGEKL